jgi:hypothetical protein
MARAPTEHEEKLINTCAPGETILAVAVPTRVFRIVQSNPSALTFRVEQMVKGKWTPLTTHGNQSIPWAAYMDALQAGAEAQAKFIKKVRARIAKNGPPLQKGLILP